MPYPGIGLLFYVELLRSRTGRRTAVRNQSPGGALVSPRETPISVPEMPPPYPGIGLLFYVELLRSRTARPRRKIPRRGGVTSPYGAKKTWRGRGGARPARGFAVITKLRVDL